MDSFYPLLAAVLLILATWFHSFRRRRNLPPGPFPLPIFGNMFQLGSKPHHTITKLAKKHGPLMSIHLGSLLTVFVSSPEMAKVILHKYGQVFSGRTIAQAVHACDHHKKGMAFIPAGEEWRDMRKICRERMFSNQSMEASKGLREEKLLQLLGYVDKCCQQGRSIDVREVSFITTLNLTTATLFSTQATEFDSKVTMEFKQIIEGVASIVGVPNFADYFPFLRPFDPQGVKKKADVYFGQLLGKVEGYLNERLQSRKTNPNAPKKHDFLETLVDIIEAKEYNLTMDHIKHLMLNLFVGGAETSTTSIEWIMSELVTQPEIMAKVKAELKSVVGDKKLVDESEMARLPYLEAVIKEVMRFHIPGPFLVPRRAESDQVVNGYFIPKGTQILINAYAISRDPDVWENPDSFEPERFLGKSIDFKGLDYELLPFGAGRRVCPGLPLAGAILNMVTATLIHNFDWKLDENTTDDDHQGEVFGLSLRRAARLRILPTKPQFG
nr:cytochrome P450 76AH59 [Salvia officinalis]